MLFPPSRLCTPRRQADAPSADVRLRCRSVVRPVPESDWWRLRLALRSQSSLCFLKRRCQDGPTIPTMKSSWIGEGSGRGTTMFCTLCDVVIRKNAGRQHGVAWLCLPFSSRTTEGLFEREIEKKRRVATSTTNFRHRNLFIGSVRCRVTWAWRFRCHTTSVLSLWGPLKKLHGKTRSSLSGFLYPTC